MAPREDLLVYDEEDVLEEDPPVHSAQQDHRGQPAASEEEGLFRCVAKTAVTADGDTSLCPHYLHRAGCSNRRTDYPQSQQPAAQIASFFRSAMQPLSITSSHTCLRTPVTASTCSIVHSDSSQALQLRQHFQPAFSDLLSATTAQSIHSNHARYLASSQE